MERRHAAGRSRRGRALALAAALLCGPAWPGPSVAHKPAISSLSSLTEELAGISRELAEARALFDEKVALRPDSAVELLNRAQVAFFEEDYPTAVSRLLDLTARPDFQRSPGYGEALTWLGESLWQLGLHGAAAVELRRALSQPSLPSTYRHTLIRYLTLGMDAEPLEHLRTAWQRYQGTRPEGPLAPEDQEVRYRYARALFRHGALGEAASLFSAIGEGGVSEKGDPYALRALYYQGVILVVREDLKGARAAFEEALTAWQGAAPPKKRDDEPDWWDVEPGSGPPLEAEEVEPVPASEVLDEPRQARLRMGQVLHLALARLDASRGNLDKAVGHYRQVPPGSPDHAAAMQELVWALYRRGEHARAARLLDTLLAGRGDDRTAAELAIWKAHMLALAADYAGSEENYRGLEIALTRRRDELEGDLSRDTRVFPEAVLAWTEPGTAVHARGLEADLVEQDEAIAEAREILTLLRDLFRSPDLLPGVRRGKLVHARLSARHAAFDQRLADTEAGLATPQDHIHPDVGPPPTVQQVGEMRQSSSRLGERLSRFATALDEAETRWRQRITEVTEAEAPNVERLAERLVEETDRARRLGMAMAVGAREKLESYAADAHFRQIDLAYWRLDEIRRRIAALRKEQRTIVEPMEQEVEDYRRELERDPIGGP